MKLTLIAWAPARRFDARKELCVDGRGGWTFSQVNVDRWIPGYADYRLTFYFGVLVEAAFRDDFVRCTRLTASMKGDRIGSGELEWKKPNPMWGYLDGDAIFEFAQPITMQPTQDGLITFSMEVLLNSQSDWLPVDGNGYCRIRRVDEDPHPDRWVSPDCFD
jgi:hypothetical protein